MRRAWSVVGLVLAAPTVVACGGIVVDERPADERPADEQPAPERTCPGDISLHFRRVDGPWACLSAEGPEGVVFWDEASFREYWTAQAACGVEMPAVPFDDALLLGVFLEGECEYSGCESVVPIVRSLRRDGCTLHVMSQPPSTESLGACKACVQPREFVRVERVLLEGVDDIVFDGLSP